MLNLLKKFFGKKVSPVKSIGKTEVASKPQVKPSVAQKVDQPKPTLAKPSVDKPMNTATKKPGRPKSQNAKKANPKNTAKKSSEKN